jgi:HEPN domain-containing protein
MRTEEMARDYLTRAAMTLEEARTAAANGIHSLAVRRAQETVELSLKAALRFLAIEYPREDDVSEVLLKVKGTRTLPEWFNDRLEFLMHVSSDLARKRGPAFYGDKITATPASHLFTAEEGVRAIKEAEEVFTLCKRLVR